MKNVAKLTVMALLAACVMALGVHAQDAPKAKKRGGGGVMGTVKVTKSDAGEVTAINIEQKDGTSVEVVLDEQGKKLAEMDGKMVMVMGKKEGNKITVTGVHEPGKKGDHKPKKEKPAEGGEGEGGGAAE